jgi:hypothetical protein
MKYVITIISTTAGFAVLGLCAAFGVVGFDQTADRDLPLIAFTMMPMGGAAIGLLTACIATGVGYCFTRQDVSRQSAG